MNNNILINVITVVFNNDKTIEKTIRSVFSQTYKHINYYIIDGNSTDNTLAIIKKYEKQLTNFICEKDTGIYDAMNKAIDLIEQEDSYLIFLNSDDYFFSDSVISDVVDSFENNDIIYGNIIYKDHDTGYSALIGKEFSRFSIPFGMIQHQATFTKKSVFTRIGKFNLDYKIVSDFDFVLHVFTNGLSLKYINMTISVMGMGGISSSQALKTFDEKIISIRKYYSGLILFLAIAKIKCIEMPRYRFSLFLKKYNLISLWRKIKIKLA